MKTIIIASMFLVMGTALKAQILTPIKWSYAAKKTGRNEAVVFIKATIDKGWHLYSQTVKDGGPVKTSFTFLPSTSYELIGNTNEPTPITRNEKVFNMDVSYFEKSVVFQQKIRLKAKQVTVKGSFKYMTCNDKQCLPPEDVDFSVAVK